MGFFNCCLSNGKTSTVSSNKPLGVSVHLLKNGLLEEVKERPHLSENSCIYDIEDLSSKNHGVIRSKGANTICPTDKRMGASYVDCLSGVDNVGPATVMLSYGWRYEIKDIIDTLIDYCEGLELDTKRTYIWICCLCNNQHRVVENRLNGTKDSSDTFDEFEKIFHSRVVEIGNVVAMMTPWDEPVYLTRVWCVFELYVASENENGNLTIVMPPREKLRMIEALRADVGLEKLYTNLIATKVENAEASEETDRVRILELVKNGPGFIEFNGKVNELIRNWIKDSMIQYVREHEKKSKNLKTDREYASLCNDVGKVIRDHGNIVVAKELFDNAIAIFERVNNDNDLRTKSDTHNNLGLTYKKMGEFQTAKDEFNKALAVGKTIWEENDYDAAQTYNNIGLALDDMKEYDSALAAYEEALNIVQNCLGKDHVNVAGALSNIAFLLNKMGKNEEAIEKMKAVIEIDEKANGIDHPDTANSYNILGVLYSECENYTEDALEQYRKALFVRQKVFGKNSIITATTFHNIGTVLYDQKKYKEALVELEKSYNIYVNTVGADHPECEVTKSYISKIKNEM